VVSFVWCVFLIWRNRCAAQFVKLPEKGSGTLGFYYLMAMLSGAFWYFQFFFYGMGQAFIGQEYEYTSWVLHMAMLILFSNIYGWLFREWQGVGNRPRRVLHIGMAAIVASTLIIACGNYLGEQDKQKKNAKDDEAAAAMLDFAGLKAAH
jgi:L-rhamnose-H+ transport protein